jgi:hypothetical protein
VETNEIMANSTGTGAAQLIGWFAGFEAMPLSSS